MVRLGAEELVRACADAGLDVTFTVAARWEASVRPRRSLVEPSQRGEEWVVGTPAESAHDAVVSAVAALERRGSAYRSQLADAKAYVASLEARAQLLGRLSSEDIQAERRAKR